LNINGPFRLINALRRIEPSETAPVKLTFTPNSTTEVRFFINKKDILFFLLNSF
jgi:hypothetical protein